MPRMTKTYTTAELRGLKQTIEEQNIINNAKSLADTIKKDVLLIAERGVSTRLTKKIHMRHGSQDHILRCQEFIVTFIREQFPDISVAFEVFHQASETTHGVTTVYVEMNVIVDWSE